jgi:uncharacterized DUF497 family protein
LADPIVPEVCDHADVPARAGVVASLTWKTFVHIHFPRVLWAPAKAKANLAAHGVRFAEAATVFDDDRAITRADPDSVGEQRFVTLGLSGFGSLLVVVYAWRGPTTIRLIFAWKANARQRKQYAQSAG